MAATVDGALTFSNLVVGASNRLAAAAAKAVVDAPGEAYNPLFIYGNPGLGKTHLAAAIAWQAMEDDCAMKTEVTTGEELVERLNEAVARGELDAFTRELQEVKLLVLDDVQFLAGQHEVQSVLMRIFNVMQGRGHQLVLTSDRQPEDIPDVDQRLLSRLSGGLIVDVGAPDLEMRLAILQREVSERQIRLDAGVLDEVARIPFGNVRELKGALNRLSAYSQLDGAHVRAEDVHAILGERLRHTRTPGAVGVLRADGTIAEYDDFFSDVADEVAHRVEAWRLRIGEACEKWQAEGYAVGVLERAMSLDSAPDVDGLLETFASAVAHLRALESMAVTVDRTLEGHAYFRDPERIEDAEALLAAATDAGSLLPEPDASLTRDRIVIGSSNKLAMQAFDQVLEHPGRSYNPFFLYGPPGSGKTLIAHAFANSFNTVWSGAPAACISAPAFMQELVAAMQEGAVESWRARYRRVALFVLDDVHLLVDKERTQDELFHLFNHLVAQNCQIVLTSDRPPAQLGGLADRLRSRFEGGLVVELRPLQLPGFQADDDSGNMEWNGGDPLTQHRSESSAVAMQPRLRPGEIDLMFLDTEKVIVDWPDLPGRLVEELR